MRFARYAVFALAAISSAAPKSSEYAVEAQVEFSRAGATLRVEAGGEFQAVADELDSQIALRLTYEGKECGAAIMRRAGARFTLGVKYPSKHKYGIGTGTDSVIGVFYSRDAIRGDPAVEAGKMIEDMKARGSNPRYWQIYWEDMLSDRHHRRYPPSLIGRPPMALNQAEEERLKSYWDRAEAYADRVRRELPREKLALGAFANFTEEFLRRGFPKKYLDAISLEATAYRTQPERPPDTENVQALYFIQEWKKKYGYQDLDTIMVESLFRGTAPGYLGERDQANYYVRDFLHGLAYGVKLFGMSAMITDVSNDYYRSSWGNPGLCHRAPEPSPKESYVAYATMTGVLDRPRYAGYLETGSASVYALHFAGRGGGNIYVLWTTRGERGVALELAGGGAAVVIDAMHNQTPLEGGRLVVSESPVYVKTAARITRVQPGAPRYRDAPPAQAAAVDPLNGPAEWRPRAERDSVLEDGNPRYPRRPGAARFAAVQDPARGECIEVSSEESPGSPLPPVYGVLERRKPAPIPGRPHRLGLWVNGNSGWGRVTFELADSKGERWIGVGGSEDSYGHGFINFDGWRWVEIDLPGHFRPDYPWPACGNWTPPGGDGLVDSPLVLTAVIVGLRDRIVYVNELVPVAGNRIRLSGLRADGAARLEIEVEGARGFLIQPPRPRPDGSRPWVWYAPTFIGRLPGNRQAWLFERLLEAGFHIAGVDVGESHGSPAGVEAYTRFHQRLVRRYGLDRRACLLAQSRGGLMLYNWAAGHADRLRCIAGIYPVCNLASYPGLARAAPAYGLSETELRRRLATFNPIGRLKSLARRRVPILHLHGDADNVVPLEQNSAELMRRYQALGGPGRLVTIPGKGHQEVPEFFESQELLQFLLSQGKAQ